MTAQAGQGRSFPVGAAANGLPATRAQQPQGAPSGVPSVLDQVDQAGTVQECPYCLVAVGGMRDFNRHMRESAFCRGAAAILDAQDRAAGRGGL